MLKRIAALNVQVEYSAIFLSRMLFRFLVFTEWTPWTNCRGNCGEPGHRTQTRVCQNGCVDISQENTTLTEECRVTEDGFEKEHLSILQKLVTNQW